MITSKWTTFDNDKENEKMNQKLGEDIMNVWNYKGLVFWIFEEFLLMKKREIHRFTEQ